MMIDGCTFLQTFQLVFKLNCRSLSDHWWWFNVKIACLSCIMWTSQTISYCFSCTFGKSQTTHQDKWVDICADVKSRTLTDDLRRGKNLSVNKEGGNITNPKNMRMNFISSSSQKLFLSQQQTKQQNRKFLFYLWSLFLALLFDCWMKIWNFLIVVLAWVDP